MPVTGPRYVNPSDPLDDRTYGAHNLIKPTLQTRTDWSRFRPPWDTLGPQLARGVRRVVGTVRPSSAEPLKVGDLPVPKHLRSVQR
jgi:hypothetical protein